jgi:chromosome partitioning protein
MLQENYPDLLFETKIRYNINLAEAPSFGKDIFNYMPECNGSIDYMSLCKEYIKREKKIKTMIAQKTLQTLKTL